MLRKKRRQAQDDNELPMDPMVDVVFQLIIFFLFTFQIKVMEDLRVAEVTQPGVIRMGEPPPVLSLKAGLEGGAGMEVFLNDTRLADGVAGVTVALNGLVRQEQIAVIPDDGVKFQDLVSVLSVVGKAGWKPKLSWIEAGQKEGGK